MPCKDIAIWQAAEAVDETLGIRPADSERLDAIRVRPARFSLDRLQRHMESSQPVVFRDCPVSVKTSAGQDTVEALVALILAGFPEDQRARVKTGRDARIRLLDVPELVRRWKSGKPRINVTDLHIRGTRFEDGIESSVLTDGNILLEGSQAIARQELFTLLMATRGAMSDSHSDDPDGSNHCFVGQKLWLAWDTFEGKAKGLEDVSRDTCRARPHFSMRKFFSLKSARWFTVEKNQTLFLPGRMTHKVITLEPYIGVGCFYITLPNCLGTLARWNRYGPLWSLDAKKNDSLVGEIAVAVIATIERMRPAPAQERTRVGFRYLKLARERFEREVPASERSRLRKIPSFARLLSVVGAI